MDRPRSERVGDLLLLKRLSRQARACCHPAALGRPPCLQALLDSARVGFCTGGFDRGLRLDGDGGAVQCGDLRRGKVCLRGKVCVRRSRRAGLSGCGTGSFVRRRCGFPGCRDPGLVGRDRRIGQSRRCLAFCRTFRDRDFGLGGFGRRRIFRLQRGDSFWFSRCREGRGLLPSAKGAAAGGTSGDFSPTGASTRSIARTALVASGLAASGRVAFGLPTSGLGASRLGASVCCANIVSGVACHDGLLANSSCAARSRAAAPSPKIKIDSKSMIAANRKRKPGSMDASSTFAGVLQGSLSYRERGDH